MLEYHDTLENHDTLESHDTLENHHISNDTGLDKRKPVLGGLQTTKVQINLRIRTV